jgi:lipid A 3-O-deacylase
MPSAAWSVLSTLVRRLCPAVVGAGLVLVPASAPHAQSASTPRTQSLIDEVRLGVLMHDVPHMWSGFSIENRQPDLNAEAILSPSFALWGGTVRPALGGTWNFDHGTSKAYADARWQVETGLGVFFGLGIGAAVHNGYRDPVSLDHKALGSRVLFHFPAEIGYRFAGGHSLSLYFEHISNGYTQRSNEGLDDLGIRYGYKF